MKLVRGLLEWIFEHVPALRPLMTRVNRAFMTPAFEGWGMLNHHAQPWDDPEWAHFVRAAEHVRHNFEHDLKADTGVTPENVDTLLWRHWVVAFSVQYTAQFAPEGALSLVECGVGDGLSSYFAATEAKHRSRDYDLHCYDIWGTVVTDVNTQSYSALSLDRTKRNLSGVQVQYHQGLIPATLNESAPAMVNFLSIDLNTATPTIDALDFFVPRLAPRAVILFDDYGHRGYEETRDAVDAYFAGRPGALLKMPTGQAIWFS